MRGFESGISMTNQILSVRISVREVSGSASHVMIYLGRLGTSWDVLEQSGWSGWLRWLWWACQTCQLIPSVADIFPCHPASPIKMTTLLERTWTTQRTNFPGILVWLWKLLPVQTFHDLKRGLCTSIRPSEPHFVERSIAASTWQFAADLPCNYSTLFAKKQLL